MKKPFLALTLTLALFVVLLGFSSLSLQAASTPITVWFTDNVDAVTATTDSTVMEQQLLSLIMSAENSIDAALYDFDRISVRDALIEARERGVTVRVITDNETYVGDLIYSELEAAGIPVRNDNRSSIMHNKFFIIDGEGVWTGSTNITDNGFTFNHNNSLYLSSVDIAAAYTIEFEEMWGGKYGTAKKDNTTHTFDVSGTLVELYFSPTDGAMSEIVTEVSKAETSIYFSIFFLTDDDLRNALAAAKARGVDVRGLWDQLGASNAYSDDEALCASGVPIKIENFGGKMHNKFMVIDAKGAVPRVITGSMNWTGAGGDRNDENTLIVHSTDVAMAYQSTFNDLWNALDTVEPCAPVPDVITYSHYLFLPSLLTAEVIAPTEAQKVQIETIIYNPTGDGLAGEQVYLIYTGESGHDITGWVLSDKDGNSYTFPSTIIRAGEPITIWSGAGTDSKTDRYWHAVEEVWDDTGDMAHLHDHLGRLVDKCVFEGGGQIAICS